jgi:transglutaminase-like putative cysteine protease
MRIFLFVTLALSFLSSINAQPVYDYEQLAKKYKGNTILVLNREQHLKLGMKKGAFDIESEHVQQFYHIDNKNVGYSEREIGYSPTFYVIKDLEANTYLPDGKGKFKKIAVTEFKDEGQVDGGSIFYDGYRYKKFKFSSLASGVISETKFTYEYKDPSHLGAFYFMWGSPHYNMSYTVTVGKDIKIGYKFFGDSSFVKHTVTKDGDNLIHKWEANEVLAAKGYDDAVNDRYFEPHVYVYIAEYKTKNEGWKPLFGTEKELYNHDYKYIENLNKEPVNEQLKMVVDSIKQVSAGEKDLMRSIYYWVQQNMRYIAFEDGLGGQVPREANDVYTKRFGDCKDFSSLITYMMKVAGVKSYMTWIGTRDLPYSYKDLPLGYASNHMIASAYIDNQWIFIDGTSNHTPFGVPSGFIQGKEAFIAINKDSFVITQVPIMPTTFNLSADSIYLTLNAGVLEGSGNLAMHGYVRSYMVDRLYYTGIDKINDYLKKYVSLGNNKCEVVEASIGNYKNNDTPVVIRFSFKLPDYVRTIDNDLYVNMHLRKVYANDKIDTTGKRIAAKELEYAYQDQSTFVLRIPDGYKIKKMPADVHYTSNDLNYHFTYSLSGNLLTFKQQSSYNKLTVELKDFDNWNKQMEILTKIYKESVILTKTKP